MLKFGFRRPKAEVSVPRETPPAADPVAVVTVVNEMTAVIEATPDPWDVWKDAVYDLDAEWERRRSQAVQGLEDVEPLKIQKDGDGWWRVAYPVLEIWGSKKPSHAADRILMLSAMRRPPPPSISVGEVFARWDYQLMAPTFKFFAEAQDWAKEHARLGCHAYGVDHGGHIASTTHPEGLDVLGPEIQASTEAQERATERAASYENEAMF